MESNKNANWNNVKWDRNCLKPLLVYNVDELHSISTNIINESSPAWFKEAYDLSFTDIYDFSSSSFDMWLDDVLKEEEKDEGIL